MYTPWAPRPDMRLKLQVVGGLAVFNDLERERDQISVQYHKLAMKYDSLPLAARRSVARKHAAERFYCAAILAFQADVTLLTADNVAKLGKTATTKRELPIDEHCPVSRAWFGGLLGVHAPLLAFSRGRYAAELLAPVIAALDTATSALRKAERWFDRVADGAENDGRADAGASLHAIVEGWNVLCVAVKDRGEPLEDAIASARAYVAARPRVPFEKPVKKTGSLRRWFDYEMPESP